MIFRCKAKNRDDYVQGLMSNNFHEDCSPNANIDKLAFSEAYIKGFSMNCCTRDTGA